MLNVKDLRIGSGLGLINDWDPLCWWGRGHSIFGKSGAVGDFVSFKITTLGILEPRGTQLIIYAIYNPDSVIYTPTRVIYTPTRVTETETETETEITVDFV